jgi:hypothetical protein
VATAGKAEVGAVWSLPEVDNNANGDDDGEDTLGGGNFYVDLGEPAALATAAPGMQ